MDIEIGAGYDKNDNEKEVACLKDPTPDDMKIVVVMINMTM